MTEEEKNKLLFEYSMKKCAECKALILLKEQIEKMKCCGNCKNVHYEWGEKVTEGICKECRKLSKWESAE